MVLERVNCYERVYRPSQVALMLYSVVSTFLGGAQGSGVRKVLTHSATFWYSMNVVCCREQSATTTDIDL